MVAAKTDEAREFYLLLCSKNKYSSRELERQIDSSLFERTMISDEKNQPFILKIGFFKPEHLGQLEFYLEALDRDVKKPNENPSVGLILCAGKDDEVVRPLTYSLQNHGLKVRYDEFEMKIGDSLRRKIDKGLANSKFGIVVLSRSFISKGWTNYELGNSTGNSRGCKHRGCKTMSKHWPQIRLGDAPLTIIDGNRGKNYPSQNDFFNDGYCLFLNTKNVKRNSFDFSACQYVIQGRDELLRKGKLKRDVK
jgi:hypothetical protein